MELSNVVYYSLYENSIYIYIIRQECGKYFIVKKNTPSITIYDITNLAREHKQKWLLQYKPVQIMEIIHSLDHWDEDKITLKYMDKHGIDNVRGGSFSAVILTSEEIFTIRTMISSANGKCSVCDALGHTKINCPILTEFNDYEVIINSRDNTLLTTEDTNKPDKNTLPKSDTKLVMGYDLISSSAKEYMSSAILSVSTATSSIWQSWFGSNKSKCLRCGHDGHKTGNCNNDIKCEDSLIFPDNKAYYPMFIVEKTKNQHLNPNQRYGYDDN